MTADEIRSIVREVLAEQREQQPNFDDVVLKATATILTGFGIKEGEKAEFTADLLHLRRWRKSVEQAQSLTFKIALTAIVTGIIGAIWMGLKAALGK